MPLSDDPTFEPPAKVPFTPGTSPFRMRGHGYLGDNEFYALHVPGGVDAIAAELDDPTLRRFLTQTFEHDRWYDLVPKVYFGLAAAKLRRVSPDTHAREVSGWHARQQFRGIYRSLIKIPSAEQVAMWLPRIAGSFQEFVTMEASIVGPRIVRGARVGMPRVCVQWYAAAFSGYMDATLEVGGIKGARCRMLSAERCGERLGMDLFRMPYEISWLG